MKYKEIEKVCEKTYMSYDLKFKSIIQPNTDGTETYKRLLEYQKLTDVIIIRIDLAIESVSKELAPILQDKRGLRHMYIGIRELLYKEIIHLGISRENWKTFEEKIYSFKFKKSIEGAIAEKGILNE